MDELILGKKKYVSTKRASQLSGYTKDYIGQLCRAGSLSAKMVGRNWYVEEGALKEHRKTFQGEPLVDSNVWDVNHIETGSRPLADIARTYVHAQEEKRREELLRELFDLKYEPSDEPLMPEPRKPTATGTFSADNTMKDGGDDGETMEAVQTHQPLASGSRPYAVPSSHILTLRREGAKVRSVSGSILTASNDGFAKEDAYRTKVHKERHTASTPADKGYLEREITGRDSARMHTERTVLLAGMLFVAIMVLGGLFVAKEQRYVQTIDGYGSSSGYTIVKELRDIIIGARKAIPAGPDELE